MREQARKDYLTKDNRTWLCIRTHARTHTLVGIKLVSKDINLWQLSLLFVYHTLKTMHTFQILDQVKYRVEWAKHQDREKKKEEEAVEKERGTLIIYVVIACFVVVFLIRFVVLKNLRPWVLTVFIFWLSVILNRELFHQFFLVLFYFSSSSRTA